MTAPDKNQIRRKSMINFIKKSRSGGCSTADVVLTQVNHEGKPVALGINVSQKVLTALENPTHLSIAFCGDRLYIAPMSPKDGFTIDKGKYRSSCRVSIKDHQTISSWIGDYNLKYDPQQKLYYVEHK